MQKVEARWEAKLKEGNERHEEDQKALILEMEQAVGHAAEELLLEQDMFRTKEAELESKLGQLISEKEILMSQAMEDQMILTHHEKVSKICSCCYCLVASCSWWYDLVTYVTYFIFSIFY